MSESGPSIDVDHLCRLAALALTDGERQAVESDLTRIIAMVDAMRAVDTAGIEPLAHPLDAGARLRPDEITEAVDRVALQAAAPATRDGLFLVPRVVE